MNRKFIAVAGVVLAMLTSCGGSTPTTPAGVSGTWDGKFTLEGVDFATITANLSQTDRPTTGDYTGQITLTSTGLNETSKVIGNVSAGTLNIVEDAGSILCKGNYTNAAQYSGTCTFNYQGQNYALLLNMHKR